MDCAVPSAELSPTVGAAISGDNRGRAADCDCYLLHRHHPQIVESLRRTLLRCGEGAAPDSRVATSADHGTSHRHRNRCKPLSFCATSTRWSRFDRKMTKDLGLDQIGHVAQIVDAPTADFLRACMLLRPRWPEPTDVYWGIRVVPTASRILPIRIHTHSREPLQQP